MITVEYGKQHPDVIVLLHGGGLNWWNYRETAEKLQSCYHVVIPVLDGHAGSDRKFCSIESNAAEMIAYIDENFGGTVAFIGGLSLGAQILTEMLSRRSNICRCALVESALVIPMKWTRRLIGAAVCMSYGLISKPWFAKLQFKSLKLKPELYREYYRDSCQISKDDMIAFLRANSGYEAPKKLAQTQAKVLVLVGRKEQKAMLCSAYKIRDLIAGSKLQVLSGLYHGEFSINYADKYTETIKNMLAD